VPVCFAINSPALGFYLLHLRNMGVGGPERKDKIARDWLHSWNKGASPVYAE
jgi:hypothetical protein